MLTQELKPTVARPEVEAWSSELGALSSLELGAWSLELGARCSTKLRAASVQLGSTNFVARASAGGSLLRSVGRSVARAAGLSVGRSIGRSLNQSFNRCVGLHLARSVGRDGPSLIEANGRSCRDLELRSGQCERGRAGNAFPPQQNGRTCTLSRQNHRKCASSCL